MTTYDNSDANFCSSLAAALPPDIFLAPCAAAETAWADAEALVPPPPNDICSDNVASDHHAEAIKKALLRVTSVFSESKSRSHAVAALSRAVAQRPPLPATSVLRLLVDAASTGNTQSLVTMRAYATLRASTNSYSGYSLSASINSGRVPVLRVGASAAHVHLNGASALLARAFAADASASVSSTSGLVAAVAGAVSNRVLALASGGARARSISSKVIALVADSEAPRVASIASATAWLRAIGDCACSTAFSRCAASWLCDSKDESSADNHDAAGVGFALSAFVSSPLSRALSAAMPTDSALRVDADMCATSLAAIAKDIAHMLSLDGATSAAAVAASVAQVSVGRSGSADAHAGTDLEAASAALAASATGASVDVRLPLRRALASPDEAGKEPLHRALLSEWPGLVEAASLCSIDDNSSPAAAALAAIHAIEEALVAPSLAPASATVLERARAKFSIAAARARTRLGVAAVAAAQRSGAILAMRLDDEQSDAHLADATAGVQASAAAAPALAVVATDALLSPTVAVAAVTGAGSSAARALLSRLLSHIPQDAASASIWAAAARRLASAE